MLSFKQRLLIMLPIFTIGILALYLLPHPYNKYVGIASISLYWIIVMIFDAKYMKKKQNQYNDKNRK